MHTRSFYDAVLLSPEDGGGSAAPAQTGAQPADAGTQQVSVGSLELGEADQKEETQPRDEPPPLEEQLSKIWDKANAPVERDPLTGKFKSKNPQPDQDAPAGDDDLDPEIDADLIGARAPTETEGDDDLPAGDKQGDGPKPVTEAMPRSWSKEDAKAWAAMPKEARDVVLRREGQIAEVIGRAGHAVKALKDNQPLLQGIDPYRDYLAQREQATGVPAGRLVNDILRFAHGLDTAQTNDAKLAVVQEIIGSFGIDLSPWIGRDANEALRSAPANDPRIEQLMQTVGELTQERQQEALRSQQQADAELAGAVNSFRSNTKDFPYFDHVRHLMSAMIGAMSEDDAARPVEVLMKEAYDQACYAHPKVRARILRDQQARLQEQHQQQVSQKHDRASKAAATNVKSGVPSPSKRTMDDDIRAVADKFYR